MRLKRLSLQGYKTFATKTEFEFDEGITSIIGPNGSGKSNIADAIRWVLGEQSYTTLRGKRTTDMIFTGSRSRPRAGMAQVILTLDNSQGWLPIDYSEVEIGRRAHRSGENEYILNGQKVRLRDISDLLATSGLSERTYTIIGQGVVDQVLSIRAEERRALFEEAAGVNHYKNKRAQSLRRLEETRHNLERVHDILAELRPRLASLKRQATRALNYEQVAADLRNLLLTWYGFKWERVKEELRQSRAIVTSVETKWQNGREELQQKQQQIDEARQRINEMRRQIAAQRETRERIRIDLEQAGREFAVLQERQRSTKRRLAELERAQPVLVERRAVAIADLESAMVELKEAQDNLHSSLARLRQTDSVETSNTVQTDASDLGRQRESVQKAGAEAAHQLQKLRQARQENEQELQVLQQSVARLETRVELLGQMTSAITGDHRDTGLVGRFTSLVTMPDQYKQAIEAALGPRLATLVTPDLAAMWRLLDDSEADKHLSAVSLEHVQPSSEALAPADPAVIGWASDLVQCQPFVRRIAQLLLRNILLVSTDPQSAFRLARQLPSGTLVVTLDGFVAHAGGLVERGTSAQLDRIRSHETEWQQAVQALETAQNELSSKDDDVRRLKEAHEAKQAEVDQILKEDERLKGLEQEANQRVSQIQQQRQILQQGVDAAHTILAGRQAVVDSRRATLNQLDLQLSNLRESQESLQAQGLLQSLADMEAQVAGLREQLKDADGELEPLQHELNERRESVGQLEQNIALIRQQAHQNETQYTQVKIAFSQKQTQAEGLLERIKADLGIVALSYDDDQTGQTPLPMSGVIEQLPRVTDVPEDIEENIQNYRGQLHRMGAVNPEAPEEYEETKERFEFLTQQIEDLEKTDAHLRRIIADLDDLTSRAFVETVEKVNVVFGETFTGLFGGGSARLALTDPDDPINSGVDIIARLPNRREQGLALLSGGERSLTAVALIFSLLKVSPTPFCVLDEVDAALDEANVNRFREMLRGLSQQTQFVVITHNRGTVQSANTLYGISMGADSASQVISMRPEEYVKQASLV